MISAFIIAATVVFWPTSDSQPLVDRALPIMRSFDTQQECQDYLRMRIAKHIEEKGMREVRQGASKGALCTPAEISSQWDEAADDRYRARELASISGAIGGQGVLKEFSK